ncbi:MAG: 3-methyl-2-oxobutanoate hydroxymethyltransferase, partial [Pseudomonadota bacterium]
MSVHPQADQPSSNRKPVSLATLRKVKEAGEKLTMLTCYDYSFAKAMDAAGVDMLLIGDSLGMVVQGHDSTLPVTLEDIAYHTACVARAKPAAMVVA